MDFFTPQNSLGRLLQRLSMINLGFRLKFVDYYAPISSRFAMMAHFVVSSVAKKAKFNAR